MKKLVKESLREKIFFEVDDEVIFDEDYAYLLSRKSLKALENISYGIVKDIDENDNVKVKWITYDGSKTNFSDTWDYKYLEYIK